MTVMAAGFRHNNKRTYAIYGKSAKNLFGVPPSKSLAWLIKEDFGKVCCLFGDARGSLRLPVLN